MKNLVLITICLFMLKLMQAQVVNTEILSIAQNEKSIFLNQFSVQKNKPDEKKLKTWKALKVSGIALTGTSAAALTTGLILIKKENKKLCSHTSNKIYNNVTVGNITVGALIGGVGMWIWSGSKLQQLKKHMNVNVSSNNIALTYRF